MAYCWNLKRYFSWSQTYHCAHFTAIICMALILWKCLVFFTHCEAPIVVVLSGSMEPTFSRGDMLFLTNFESPLEIGEVLVYKLPGQDIPIVHRSHISQDKGAQTHEIFLLTKGDNNTVDDRGLYPKGEFWLTRGQVLGRITGYLPYLGYLSIFFADYPLLKYGLGLLILFLIFFGREILS